MDPERWDLVTEIFEAARGRESGEQEIFLLEACKSDALLRAEVESLLIASRSAEDFIETPVAESAVALLSQSVGDSGVTTRESLEGKSLLHYQIQEKLGEGGMGVVYRAIDSHLDRSVAIKVLATRRVQDPGLRRRLLREAKAASALNHPNIITIHDTATVEGIDFIVMEYVAGQGLDRLLACGGMLLADVLRYATQITDALAAAHAAGIVHRDLKPANIMIGANGLVKVLDFGVAKLLDEAQSSSEHGVPPSDGGSTSLTVDGMLVGTDAYMSPEQVQRGPTDARSDIFSFGSLLYEMLSGSKAFPGTSRTEVLAAIIDAHPQPLQELMPGLPAALEPIVARCLEKHPESRWQSMLDLRLALRELEERRTLTNAAASWLRQRPVSVKMAAAACLAILILTVWQIPRWRSSRASGSLPVLQQIDELEVPFWAVSPDGQWLAYLVPEFRHLRIKSIANGQDSLVVQQTTDVNFGWSGDSRRLVVRTRKPDRQWQLEILDWPSSERAVIRQGSPYDAVPDCRWSPDDRLCCRVSIPGYEEQIGFLSAADSYQTLTPLIRTAQSHGAEVSPNGRFVLYAANQNNNWDIYLARTDLTNTAQTRLTEDPSMEGAPLWSPDGQLVLFWSRQSAPDGDLWALRIDSASGQRVGEPFLLQNLSLPTVPSWSMSTEGTLYFTRTKGVLPRVFFADVDPFSSQPVSKPAPALPEGTYAPGWSVDGTNLTYKTADSRAQRDLRSGEERRIEGPRSYVVGIDTPSPDGQSITFFGWPRDSQNAGQKGIYEFTPSTAKTTLLWKSPTGMNPPMSWSTDGEEFLFGLWPSKGKFPVMVLERSTGRVREVASSRSRPFQQWSFDGSAIAYSDSGCLKVIPSHGGEARILACAPDSQEPAGEVPSVVHPGEIAWSPDGRKLAWAVVNRTYRRLDLWIVDHSSGDYVVWPGETAYRSWVASPQWSPDGRRIAFEMRYRSKVELWTLSNILSRH